MPNHHHFTYTLRSSSRKIALAGLASIVLFAGTVGVWAVSSTLSGAVVARGQFVVDGAVKKIQHGAGGVVADLRVREGDAVAKDQILIHLDDTAVRANLEIIETQLDELAARRLRLEAERDQLPEIRLPAEDAHRIGEPRHGSLVATEQTLFQARRVARAGQKEQFRRQIEQLRDQITGVEAQEEARQRQNGSIDLELTAANALFEQRLITLTRKGSLDRAAASLDGQKGQFAAAIAQARGKIAETEVQILQVDDNLREEVLKELRDIQSKAAELQERRIAVREELYRADLRAPIDGFVHQLTVHTIGGVLAPAETAMVIVPGDRHLQVEAHVKPSDIDQIAIGKPAEVKLDAFNQRSTPRLNGGVELVSADTTKDEDTGAYYYTVRIGLPANAVADIAPHQVTAGMEADVFIKTEDRTPLEFFLKPVMDQYSKAFRER